MKHGQHFFRLVGRLGLDELDAIVAVSSERKPIPTSMTGSGELGGLEVPGSIREPR
jgi:hypothetical protein